MAELKDSGNRTEFASGAVRDIQEGKGRCDLLPLKQIAKWLNDPILDILGDFISDRNTGRIYILLDHFVTMQYKDSSATVRRGKMVLEVAKHFEDGAIKYGDRNWEKGIPINRFLDSGIRHYLKCLIGLTDEPHDRAFVWNMLAMLWTIDNKGWLEEEPSESKQGVKIGKTICDGLQEGMKTIDPKESQRMADLLTECRKAFEELNATATTKQLPNTPGEVIQAWLREKGVSDEEIAECLKRRSMELAEAILDGDGREPNLFDGD